MTALDFTLKIKEGLDLLPDTDGEPGYFADMTGYSHDIAKDHATAYFEIADAELPVQRFRITVEEIP